MCSESVCNLWLKNDALEKQLAAEDGYIHEDGDYKFRSSFRSEPRFLIPALILIALITWWGVNRALEWYWIVLLVLFIFAAGICITWRFTIEPKNGVIREEAFLFGRRLLNERFVPLADFKYLSVKEGNHSGVEGIVYNVSLRRKSGGEMFLKYYHTARPAEELAWRLHCDTGHEIENRIKTRI